jgi:hypothetical protein
LCVALSDQDVSIDLAKKRKESVTYGRSLVLWKYPLELLLGNSSLCGDKVASFGCCFAFGNLVLLPISFARYSAKLDLIADFVF